MHSFSDMESSGRVPQKEKAALLQNKEKQTSCW